MIPPSLDAAIAHATRSWTTFAVDRNHKARLAKQETRCAADGGLLVSFQVVGPDAGKALAAFAGMAEYLRTLQPDDLRPVFDYGTPGRTACVWRTAGVWVELWHPDTAPIAPAAPEPVPDTTKAVPGPSPRGLLGGRLPFSRRRKETSA